MRLRYLLPFLLIATPAAAVDFSAPIMDPDGRPACREAVLRECPPDQIATLGWYVRNALYAQFPDEQNLPGEDKAKRGALAQALVGASELKLKVEDLALIKKLVGKAYGPLIVFQAWNLLEK